MQKYKKNLYFYILNQFNDKKACFIYKVLIMNKIKFLVEKIRHSYYNIMKVLGFVLALIIVVWLMPRNVKFKYEYQKMRPWQHETLYAPFNFPIYKSYAVRKDLTNFAQTVQTILSLLPYRVKSD